MGYNGTSHIRDADAAGIGGRMNVEGYIPDIDAAGVSVDIDRPGEAGNRDSARVGARANASVRRRDHLKAHADTARRVAIVNESQADLIARLLDRGIALELANTRRRHRG